MTTPDVELPQRLRQFLRRVRDGLESPGTASALGALISGAEHDPSAAAALARVSAQRAQDFIEAFGEPPPVDPSQAIGPIMFFILVLRRPFPDDHIDHIVTSCWAETDPKTSLRETVRRQRKLGNGTAP